MKVEYSRQFVKAAFKLSGKYKLSLQKIITEVQQAKEVTDLTDFIKLVGLQQSYRIKMGNYRLIFMNKIQENIIILELLVSRGEVYKKEYETFLKYKEKDIDAPEH